MQANDNFITSKTPSAAAVQLMHRGHDGYITFHQKQGSEFRQVGAVKGQDLAGWFPEFVDQLATDGYHSVNAFYRPARKRSTARWLTSVFSDLDVGRPGTLPTSVALGSLIELQDRGRIPPASFFYRSGQGLWSFWLLVDDTDGGCVRAWPENILTWDRVQAAIHRRLAPLYADPASKDVARVTRVLGSINSKSGRQVAYWPQLDGQGQPFIYTLSGLCKFFRVAPVKFIKPPQKAVPARRRGYDARLRGHLDRVQTLQHLRGGGFSHGHRYSTCKLLASLMKSLCFDLAAIRQAVYELGRFGRSWDGKTWDPLPDSDIEAAISAAGPVGKITNATVAGILRITPAEASAINFQPSPKYQGTTDTAETEDMAPSRSEVNARRFAFISQLVKDKRHPPKIRDMIELCKEYGMTANERQVIQIYRQIGIKGRSKTPKTGATQKHLFCQN